MSDTFVVRISNYADGYLIACTLCPWEQPSRSRLAAETMLVKHLQSRDHAVQAKSPTRFKS